MSGWGIYDLKTKGHAFGYYVIDNDIKDDISEWKLTINSNIADFNVYISFGQ